MADVREFIQNDAGVLAEGDLAEYEAMLEHVFGYQLNLNDKKFQPEDRVTQMQTLPSSNLLIVEFLIK